MENITQATVEWKINRIKGRTWSLAFSSLRNRKTRKSNKKSLVWFTRRFSFVEPRETLKFLSKFDLRSLINLSLLNRIKFPRRIPIPLFDFHFWVSFRCSVFAWVREKEKHIVMEKHSSVTSIIGNLKSIKTFKVEGRNDCSKKSHWNLQNLNLLLSITNYSQFMSI